MTLTIYSWVIAAVLTLPCIVFMLLPMEQDEGGLGFIFRLLWFIPILAIWAIYFAVMYFSK